MAHVCMYGSALFLQFPQPVVRLCRGGELEKVSCEPVLLNVL